MVLSRWPQDAGAPVWLAGATVPAALLDASDAARLPAAAVAGPLARRVAVRLAGGRIAALEPVPSGGDAPVIDLDDATLVSAFVEPHAHLDKGDLLAMGLPVHRRLFDAIAAVRADYARWTPDELHARMDFGLRSAHAHGTRALRSYLDWPVGADRGGPPVAGDPSPAWAVAVALREAWRGRVDLQPTSLVTIDALADDAAGERLARRIADDGGVLGVFVYPASHVPALVPRVFALAARFDLDVDFHVDEHLVPPDVMLPHVLAAARRHGWGPRTVCGHACALHGRPAAERDALLAEAAALGVALVSLPATNLHLQDSAQQPPWTTPGRRGLLPVHEARRLGVAVGFGADNHRDPFHPGGDLDPLQTLALAAWAAQLDDPLHAWIDAVTTVPAVQLGCPWDGRLRAGAPADLVVLPARSSPEWLARPTAGRTVVRSGRPLDGAAARPPDFRELDRWREARGAGMPR